MACTGKTELINLTVKEFFKLNKLIALLDDTQAGRGEEDTSIKDVIGHRAHWIDLFLGWYSDGMAGKEVFFPAKGYKWNERHGALVQFVTEKSDADLYSGPMQGANNTWTPGRWVKAAGPSHYRSAAKFIRPLLRTQS
jgi:hypothetical protein